MDASSRFTPGVLTPNFGVAFFCATANAALHNTHQTSFDKDISYSGDSVASTRFGSILVMPLAVLNHSAPGDVTIATPPPAP